MHLTGGALNVKVFISWSGPTSCRVANELRDWLPSVIQSIHPYVSEEDIDKGARWISEISKELEAADFGVVCVTPENLESDWLNFEAGALSKSFDASHVAPFLLGIKKSEVKGPISQFQATSSNKLDMLKLVKALNSAMSEGQLEDSAIEKGFEVWWPHIESKLRDIEGELAHAPAARATERDSADVLEELLELVRGQQRLLSNPEELLPPEYVNYVLERSTRMPPRGHAVLRDLDASWSRIRRMLVGVDPGDPVNEELLEGIRRLSRPIEFLVSRYGRPEDLRQPRLSDEM